MTICNLSSNNASQTLKKKRPQFYPRVKIQQKSNSQKKNWIPYILASIKVPKSHQQRISQALQ
jgi:predicted nucleic acid binding AN1-type Zn finger protein